MHTLITTQEGPEQGGKAAEDGERHQVARLEAGQ